MSKASLITAHLTKYADGGRGMSDLMLISILRMPPELWGDDPLSVMQRHSAYMEAAIRLERQKGCNICGGMVDLTNAVKPTSRR